MSKTLWIMCGPAGAGKTWFAKHKLCNGPGWYYVSRDEVRFSLLKDEDDYFSREDEVFDLFISKIVRGFYEEGVYNIVADATHLSWGSRKKLLNAIKFYMGFRWKDNLFNVGYSQGGQTSLAVVRLITEKYPNIHITKTFADALKDRAVFTIEYIEEFFQIRADNIHKVSNRIFGIREEFNKAFPCTA